MSDAGSTASSGGSTGSASPTGGQSATTLDARMRTQKFLEEGDAPHRRAKRATSSNALDSDVLRSSLGDFEKAERPKPVRRSASVTGAASDMAKLAAARDMAAAAKLKDTFAKGPPGTKKAVPGEKDGGEQDLDFDTPANTAKRAALRQHVLVLKALGVWWATAKNSMERSREKYDLDIGANEIRREEYVMVSRKLYKSLLEDWNEEEADRNANREWEEDTKGARAMPKEMFFDAFFELADLWTEAICPYEYSEFLRTLLGSIP